jgi:hypothetical protein
MMADYDAAQVRAVLREHGHEVPSRGRISSEDLARYAELANGGQAPAPPEDEPGEYDAGVSAADFPGDDSPAVDEAPPMAETRPRRPGRSRGTLGQRIRQASGKAKTKSSSSSSRKPKRHPRVPVDRLIERSWEVLARISAPVSPPVSRCLQIQSPVAGLILEDVIRDTAVDRALQPIARAEEKAERVIALVAPPVLVGALQAAQGLPEDQRMMRQAILVPMLRESMVLWVKIAGDKVQEKATRDAELAPIYAQVDQLMAFIAGEAEPGGQAAEQAGAMAGASA